MVSCHGHCIEFSKLWPLVAEFPVPDQDQLFTFLWVAQRMLRSVRIASAAVFVILSMVALWSQTPVTPPATPPPALGLAAGDTIAVTLYDFPDMRDAISATVSPEGTIHLPYAGTVKVLGLSPSDAETAIERALQSRNIVKDPSASIKIINSTTYVAFLTGEVNRPGPIPLLAPTPLSYILSQGSGFNGIEGKHIIILHRTSKLPESVDFDSENPTVAAMNTIVYPGDIVRVSTAGVFYVIGEVGRQGIYPITGGITAGNGLIGLGKIRNMTLLQALTYAGGITSIAARSKAIVIRTKPDGSREIIHFDILKLEKGQIADPIIQPNDIIFVPSSYLRNITNNLFTSIINAAYLLPIVTTTANNP